MIPEFKPQQTQRYQVYVYAFGHWAKAEPCDTLEDARLCVAWRARHTQLADSNMVIIKETITQEIVPMPTEVQS